MFREARHMEEIHEAHFYHEEPLPTQVSSPLIYEKGGLHLNLHADIHQNPRLEQLRRNNIPSTGEIHSPDFGILRLASPDLEKMLLAFQAGQGDSPSAQTPHVTMNQPSALPNEQLNFTKGLPEVLQELHDRQENTDVRPNVSQLSYIEETVAAGTDQLYLTTDANGVITVASTRDKFPVSVHQNSFCPIPEPKYTEKQLNTTYILPSYPTNTLLPNTTAQLYTTPLRHPTEDHEAVTQLRALTAYNNVLASNPAFPSQVYKLDSGAIFGESQSLQPIDLEMQEMVKRERKKQRNRVASSKCRKRKLEKEAVLETSVKDLRTRNTELSALANALKQQICDLKQNVMDHVGEGCPMTLQNEDNPHHELYSESVWEAFPERT